VLALFASGRQTLHRVLALDLCLEFGERRGH
jgi:hypothetical protein